MIKKALLLSSVSLITLNSYAYAPWVRNYEPKKYIRLDTGFVYKNYMEDYHDPDDTTTPATPSTNNYKNSQGIIAGGAMGYEFMGDYRGELNILYTPPSKTKIEKTGGYAEFYRSHVTLFTNIYYAPQDFEIVKPYAFFGIGFSRNRTSDIKDFNNSGGLMNVQTGGGNTHYAWNTGAGITLGITQNSVFDIGYRYINFGVLKSRQRGNYGPANTLTGSHQNPAYNYNFGNLKAHQIGLSLRFFVK